MTAIRVGFSRVIAVLLIVAQAAAYGLSPWAEARAGSPGNTTPGIESRHSDTCVVVHRPDNCIACQLLSARAAGPGAPVIAALPDAPAIVIGSPTPVDAAVAAPVLFPLQPRAPPAPSA